VHFDQARAHASPQISVSESEGDPQLPCERTLCDCVVPLDRCEYAQHDAGVAHIVDLALFPHPDRPRCLDGSPYLVHLLNVNRDRSRVHGKLLSWEVDDTSILKTVCFSIEKAPRREGGSKV